MDERVILVDLNPDGFGEGWKAVADLWDFEVRTYAVGPELSVEEDPDWSSQEGVLRRAVQDMRLALGRCFVFGRMRLMIGDDAALDAECEEFLGAAIDAIPDEDLMVGTEQAREFFEEANANAWFFDLLKRRQREVGIARGLTKEQREEMTLGELLGGAPDDG